MNWDIILGSRKPRERITDANPQEPRWEHSECALLDRRHPSEPAQDAVMERSPISPPHLLLKYPNLLKVRDPRWSDCSLQSPLIPVSVRACHYTIKAFRNRKLRPNAEQNTTHLEVTSKFTRMDIETSPWALWEVKQCTKPRAGGTVRTRAESHMSCGASLSFRLLG